MTKNWTIAEKSISLILIIWSCLLAYSRIHSLIIILNMLRWDEVSLPLVLKNYHLPVLLPTLSVIAGLFLFFNSKIGWAASLTVILLNAFVYLIPSRKHNHFYSESHLGLILFSIWFTILSIVLAVILMQPPFIEKYQPTKKTWMAIVATTILVLLDRAIIYFIS